MYLEYGIEPCTLKIDHLSFDGNHLTFIIFMAGYNFPDLIILCFIFQR